MGNMGYMSDAEEKARRDVLGANLPGEIVDLVHSIDQNGGLAGMMVALAETKMARADAQVGSRNHKLMTLCCESITIAGDLFSFLKLGGRVVFLVSEEKDVASER